MPSKAHDWLADYLAAARRDHPGAAGLEDERARAEQNAALIGAPPGVVEEPVAALPGSLLLTPPDPREDLMLVFVHGGGFRIGTPGSLRTAAGILALRTGARVLCPKYRLAPEFPYPAGLDDCENAYLFARGLAPRARLVVGGESAGAGLAAALLLRRRAAGDRRIAAGLLFSGVFDLNPGRWAAGSWVDNADTDIMLAPELGPLMTADYAGRLDPADPGISPLHAELAGLPPLLVHVSGAEMLLDDSLRFAAKAGKAGVETVLEIWPGMHHSWPVFAGLLPEGVEALERAAAFVRRVADGHVVDGPALADDPEVLRLLP
jgi:monoterpene epsilon-lactone hydrolase